MTRSSLAWAAPLAAVACLSSNPVQAFALLTEPGAAADVVTGTARVALFRHGASTTAVHFLEVDATPGHGALAWLIALPSAPIVAAASWALLDELDRYTAPTSSWGDDARTSADSGCGFGGGDPVPDSNEPISPPVELRIESSTLFAPAVIQTLAPASGSELAGALIELGYEVPTRTASLLEPLASAGWTFVIASIPGSALQGEMQLALQLSYADPDWQLATRMLSFVAEQNPQARLTVYAVATAGVALNHESMTLTQLAPEGWDDAVGYRSLLEQELVSDARLRWVVESAAAMGEGSFASTGEVWPLAEQLGMVGEGRQDRLHLTRLTTLASALGAEAATDLQLSLDPEAEPVSRTILIPPGLGAIARASRPGLAGWPLLLLAWLLTRIWRRRLQPPLAEAVWVRYGS